MNRFYLFIISYLLIGVMSSKAQTIIPDQNKKGKWGYVDADGKKVIDYKFKEAYSFIDGKAKVKKRDKWGYINMKGDEVIKVKYSEMNEWDGDYCKIAEGGNIKDGVLTGAKWGVINRRGETIVKPEYDEIGIFENGVSYIKKGEKYGYLDSTYRILIPCKYSAVGAFNEQGFLWVNEGGKFDKKKDPNTVKKGKFGVYKRNGTLIVPVKYKAIGTFTNIASDANPLMAHVLNSPEYMKEIKKIKKHGWTLVKIQTNPNPFSFKSAVKYDFSASKEYVLNHVKELDESYIKKWSVADQQLYKECGTFNLLTYDFLYPQKFSKLVMPYNTYIAVSNRIGLSNANGELNLYDYRKANEKFLHKIGVFDGDGNELISADKFDMAYCPNDGFISVVREKKKKMQSNYYNTKTGKLLFKEWVEIDIVTPFEKGNAIVATKNKQYLINKEGDKISGDYSLIFPMREGIYVVKKDNKCGIVDSLGKEIISPTYNLIRPVSEGFMCTQKEEGGLYGFLDKKGNFTIPEIYDDACSFNFGWARVHTKSGWGEIDSNNKEVIKCQWNNMAEKTELNPKFMWVQTINNGLWYCLSTETDKLAFDKGYTTCRNFNKDFDGVAIVGDNNKVGCISSKGDILIPCVMPNNDLTIKAYSEMVNTNKHSWSDIDTYRFLIYNDQNRNKSELTGTIDNNTWDY